MSLRWKMENSFYNSIFELQIKIFNNILRPYVVLFWAWNKTKIIRQAAKLLLSIEYLMFFKGIEAKNIQYSLVLKQNIIFQALCFNLQKMNNLLYHMSSFNLSCLNGQVGLWCVADPLQRNFFGTLSTKPPQKRQNDSPFIEQPEVIAIIVLHAD